MDDEKELAEGLVSGNEEEEPVSMIDICPLFPCDWLGGTEASEESTLCPLPPCTRQSD